MSESVPRAPRILKLPPWTHARFEWTDTDTQLRSFLKLTHKWMDAAFEALWDEVGQRPGDPDGPDQPDVFLEETGGLWPGEYNWLLHSLLVRDAVSAFEIYLEKAADEVLRSVGQTSNSTRGQSPRWETIASFYRTRLSEEVATDRVMEIRKIRQILTHQRGELRTQELRRQFANADLFPDNWIRLAEDEVTKVFDDLANAVRTVDPVARQYIDGTKRLADGPTSGR
jgi:hypothetical protein